MKKIKLDGLSKKCIDKFFFTKLPDINRISKSKEFKKEFKKSSGIESLGVEGCQEAIYKMFEDGSLRVAIIDENNYQIFYKHNSRLKLIHKVENGLILN